MPELFWKGVLGAGLELRWWTLPWPWSQLVFKSFVDPDERAHPVVNGFPFQAEMIDFLLKHNAE